MTVQKVKVVMYTKDPCPYCVNAKRLLNNKGIQVEEIDLTDNTDEMIRLKNKYNWRTVPMILINDQFIGGYDDMKALDREGRLDPLLGIVD
jgi:glutaredoxin 3